MIGGLIRAPWQHRDCVHIMGFSDGHKGVDCSGLVR